MNRYRRTKNSRFYGTPAFKFCPDDQILEKPQKTRPVRQDNANSCRTGHLSGFPIWSGYGITTPPHLMN
jgi:hypothetical protein